MFFDFYSPSSPIVRSMPLNEVLARNDAISRKASLTVASERLGPSSRHVSVATSLQRRLPERKHHSTVHFLHNYRNIFRRASTS